MTICIKPKDPACDDLDMPNGFWPALCVETPVSQILECEYTDRNTIKYEHDGFVGGWISEAEAQAMHKLLLAFIETEAFEQHRYFSEIWRGEYVRRNQMQQILEFLPKCGGFRMVH